MFCRYSITRMDPKKHVFLLTPMDSNSKDAPFVAKVVATPYPEQLHEELFCTGLAPKLREPVQKYPGGMILYFYAVAFNPLVAASMRSINTLARSMLPAVYGGCLCLQQLLQYQSGVLLLVSWLFSSVCSAYPKCTSFATLSSFSALCAVLAKPGTCQRS